MRQTPLHDKKILLLAPRFYGYYQVIKNELETMGAEVTYAETFIFLEDFRNNKNLIDWGFRFIRNPRYRKKHTYEILKITESKKFDIVITVSVFSPSRRLLEKLKKRNPNLKSYIYFWDAFSTWNFRYQMKYFDYKYSFDLNDCRRYEKEGLQHLPLFWSENQISRENDFTYDIVHIGTLHPKYRDRISVCSQLYDWAQDKHLCSFIYLVSDIAQGSIWRYPLKQTLKYLFNSEFRHFVNEIRELRNHEKIIRAQPLPQNEVHDIEKRARCIVDVNIDRAGVAMRIIGALANGQKIITNNKYIIDEQFYNPDNICIIDKSDIKINTDWLFAQSSPTDMSALRIDNWIKHLLRIDNRATILQ